MENSDKGAEKFVLNFFQQIDTILEEKKGGKLKKRKGKFTSRSYKKQKGGVKNEGTPDLPVSLSESNQSDIVKLQQELESNTDFKRDFSIKITPSTSLGETSSTSSESENINNLFAQHISNVLRNINSTSVLELTPQELQVLALFSEFKKLNTKANEGSNIVSQNLTKITELPSKAIVEDDKSEENIQLMSKVLEHVEGPPDLVDRQIKVIETITDNAVSNIQNLTQLYDSNATPQEISKGLLSNFMNLTGNLAALFNMLSCFSNRISNMASVMKNNPIIYFLIKTLQICISFIVYLLNQLFFMLINTFIGKSCLIIIFMYYYRQNNPIAIFLANSILKLLKIVDANVGISDYANQCFTAIQQQLSDYLPQLLTSAAVTTFANSVITSALSSPEVMSNFISSIAPELSRQVIEQSLPTITKALASEVTPQLIQGITSELTPQLIKGVSSNIISQVGPQLIESVSTNMVTQLMPELINGVTQTMITDVAPQIATQVASQLAITSAQNSLFNAASASLSKVAVSYAINGAATLFGIDTSVVQPVTGLLTNSGGKTIKLKKLKRTKRYRRYKKTKTYKK